MLGWIADFYCPKIQLVLEIDGEGHDASRDAERDASMHRVGMSVLRISAEDVYSRFPAVIQTIEKVVLH